MRLTWLVAPIVAMTGCVADSDPTADTDEPGGGKADDWSVIPGGWDAIAARCAQPAADAPTLNGMDFRWYYTHAEMAARFDEVYAGDKRLYGRAYYDSATNKFIMPHVPAWGGRVELSRRLVESVSKHISAALEKRYAEWVFFPDMGHSHFFIPQAHWDAKYASTEVAAYSMMYTRLLADPELVMLYHTAEQLQTHTEEGEPLPDEHLMYRFANRNPIGDNKGTGRLQMLSDPTSRHNTVREYAGHHYFSAGFNISANEDGCFPYVVDGKVYYFDISLYDLI